MVNLTTPGVKIQEVSTIPPSVSPVATAIPGFVGYTEIGEPNVPVRISSFVEFEQMFGGPMPIKLDVIVFDEEIKVTDQSLTAAADEALITPSNFLLYYSVRSFYDNGGGACYISSAGNFTNAMVNPQTSKLTPALTELRKIDEVTLLVIPDLMNVPDNDDYTTLVDTMLSDAQNAADRFAIIDVKPNLNTAADASPLDQITAFRNGTGTIGLDYGGAYYPPLLSNFNPVASADMIRLSGVGLPTVAGFIEEETFQKYQDDINDLEAGDFIPMAQTDLNTAQTTLDTAQTALVAAQDALDNADPAVDDITALTLIRDNEQIAVAAAEVIRDAAQVKLDDLNDSAKAPSIVAAIQMELELTVDLINTAINTALGTVNIELGPSGPMAGVYARIDGETGVFAAPANTSLIGLSPTVRINNDLHGLLNVDAGSGKSVNAIRDFAGRGTLVFGARTLDGNSNEFRYVNVRRLFLFIEESIQNATEAFVFQPNVGQTWERIRGLITNFLTNQWRIGALAGAQPSDAFFVQVGLGTTMTADDILNGILNVEIGIAPVRPAEFIVLRFSQLVQSS